MLSVGFFCGRSKKKPLVEETVIAWSKRLESFVILMSKNSISGDDLIF